MTLKDIRKRRQRVIFEECTQEKITIEEIIDFEDQYNIKLPEQYRNFLLDYNGGHVAEGYFIPPDNDDDLIDLTYFNKLEDIEVGTTENGFSEDGFDVLPPKGFMMIANTFTGHSEILIGIEDNENYGKIFYNVDRQDEWTYLLANNFEEFLNNLLPKYENDFHMFCMEGEIEKVKELVNNDFKCNYMYYFALYGYFNAGYNDKIFYELLELMINKGLNIKEVENGGDDLFNLIINLRSSSHSDEEKDFIKQVETLIKDNYT